MSTSKSNFWSSPLTKSRITSDDVKMPEMLLGYFIGPFGALLSSGIFTSILQNYFTDVLKLDLGFLTTLQLVSTVLIVASNLIVGQLIEHTKALAGKARPWILLSALTLSVASVLMFIVPFEGMAKMVWIAIAYNLYYAVAYPIYNTANSTMIPASTRQQAARCAGFLHQRGGSGRYGLRLDGIPDARFLRAEGGPAPVVPHHAGRRHLQRTDHLPAVPLHP